jgi:hypothetical protein
LRSAGIGTTVASLAAPLIALFIGGYVAGRLATTFDGKVGATHGLVTWANRIARRCRCGRARRRDCCGQCACT